MAAREPLTLGQELIQVAAPARRVLSAAQPLRLGGIKHALDPPAKAGGGFRLLVPKRLQDRKHVIGGDLVHRQPAKRRRIVPQRHFPLRSVLAVAPGRAHGLDHPVGAFAERGAF